MKKEYLLEVGCENIPSGYLKDALRQIETVFSGALARERIAFDSISVMGTPNRLVVHIRGLSSKQASTRERVTGPPVSAAFTADGVPTRAALGFARSQGVPVSRLTRVTTDRGEYVAVVKLIRGRSTASILKQSLPKWIADVRFPKVMRWNDSPLRFARPIRWMVSLLGDSVVKFSIGALSSGARTRLSPFFRSSESVAGIDDYFSLMRRHGIILDVDRRRGTVERMARRAARKCGGSLVADEELIRSVANLLECPVVLTGAFDDSFLKLPREVIVTALKSHQRYFSVEDAGGKLTNAFIAFADGVRRNRREIVKGYERVLHARLADAAFYFREDTARPLAEMARRLEGIVWLEGMGSLMQKSERIELLAEEIRASLGAGGEDLQAKLQRAARLAKADLASEMVKDGKEFTLLQGYIGREYAHVSGEDRDVAEAIYEHYLPRFSTDAVPRSQAGIILAIADRLDSVTGCYLAGLEPTGSQDPYALRRHVLGLLRIAIERAVPVSLRQLIDRALSLYAAQGFVSKGDAVDRLDERIMEFFTNRFNVMLKEQGFDYDLVSAMLHTPWEDPGTVKLLVGQLQRMRDEGTLAALALAVKRVINILPRSLKGDITQETGVRSMTNLAEHNEGELGFSSALFSEKAEGNLYRAVAVASERLLDLRKRGEPAGYFAVLSSLAPDISTYFENVLVNCEDENARHNRLSFLSSIYRFMELFCDFSKITGE